MKIQLALLNDDDSGKYTTMDYDPEMSNKKIMEECLQPMLKLLRGHVVLPKNPVKQAVEDA